MNYFCTLLTKTPSYACLLEGVPPPSYEIWLNPSLVNFPIPTFNDPIRYGAQEYTFMVHFLVIDIQYLLFKISAGPI